MPRSHGKHLLRSAGVVGLMTLVSRITGVLIQRLVGSQLGVGPLSDAYQVAYRLPNMLRRFTAEGTMTAAFLPTLAEVETREGEAGAHAFVADFLGSLGALLLALSAVGVLLMTPIAGLLMLGKLAPGAGVATQLGMLGEVLRGHRAFPADIALSAACGRIMFPYVLLVSLTAALAAVLNLRQRFALAASSNTFGNLAFLGASWLALAWMGGPRDARAALVFASAMLLHGLVQVAVLLPAFHRLGFRFGWRVRLSDPHVRRALRRMLPGILAGGLHPINVLVSQSLASQLQAGAQTVLANANVLGELVLGLFAVSVATVSLPTLSRQAAEGDLEGVRESLGTALRGTALLAIPGAVGMALLATPIVALLFHKGAFGTQAVAWTAGTLPFQALGLLFIGSARIGGQTLNALGDYRGPALAAGVGFTANIVLSLVLMRPLGTAGMALANSLAALASLACLTWRLRRSLGHLPLARVGSGWAQMGAAAALMGVAAWAGGRVLHLQDAGSFQGVGGTALRLFPLIGACGGLYGALLLLLRVPEAADLWKVVRRKLGLPVGH